MISLSSGKLYLFVLWESLIDTFKGGISSFFESRGSNPFCKNLRSKSTNGFRG